jgi:hypothetical protein
MEANTMTKDQEPIDLVVLGRKIGTYKGWDEYDPGVYVFYETTSSIGGLREGDLFVDYNKGLFSIGDDWSADMLEILKHIPRT